MSLICRFEWKIIHLKQSSEKRSTRQWAPMMMTMMFKTIIPYNENDKWWKRAKHTLCVYVCHGIPRLEKCTRDAVSFSWMRSRCECLKLNWFSCECRWREWERGRKSKEIREAYKQVLANAEQERRRRKRIKKNTIIEVNLKALGAITKTMHGEKLTKEQKMARMWK